MSDGGGRPLNPPRSTPVVPRRGAGRPPPARTVGRTSVTFIRNQKAYHAALPIVPPPDRLGCPHRRRHLFRIASGSSWWWYLLSCLCRPRLHRVPGDLPRGTAFCGVDADLRITQYGPRRTAGEVSRCTHQGFASPPALEKAYVPWGGGAVSTAARRSVSRLRKTVFRFKAADRPRSCRCHRSHRPARSD